jgi:tetratricopeptide (TPR) repeat protein
LSSSKEQLFALIPQWIALSRDRQIDAGLTRDEALRRARRFRQLLSHGRLAPGRLKLDEDLKDVLHALVALVTEIEPLAGEAIAQEANAVSILLRGISWPDDSLDEKFELIERCAVVGFRALGRNLETIKSARLALLNGEDLPVSEGTAAFSHYRFRREGQDLEETQRNLGKLFDARLSQPLTAEACWELCLASRALTNILPRAVQLCVIRLFKALDPYRATLGLFDEQDFFRGYASFLAGSASRLLGLSTEALTWLETAEAVFGSTVTPELLLAEVAAERTALEYEHKSFARAVAVSRAVGPICQRVGLWRANIKCRLVEASSLKEQERYGESLLVLEGLRRDPSLPRVPVMHANVLVKTTGVLFSLQRRADAFEVEKEALRVAQASDQPMALADLKGIIAEALRDQGMLAEAVVGYRGAIQDYEKLGMSTYVAYIRVVVAETLLAQGRVEEAQEEIRSAMPTIEKEQMVREGAAVLALLRDSSIQRRQADPNPLRELRKQLLSKAQH